MALVPELYSSEEPSFETAIKVKEVTVLLFSPLSSLTTTQTVAGEPLLAESHILLKLQASFCYTLFIFTYPFWGGAVFVLFVHLTLFFSLTVFCAAVTHFSDGTFQLHLLPLCG